MTTRPTLLLTILCFLSSNTSLFSQGTPYAQPTKEQAAEPYIEFPKKLMDQLAGTGAGAKLKGIITCSDLLNKTWPYPDARVTPFCYDAETACMRYDLLKQQARQSRGAQLESLQNSISHAHHDSTMKLWGCRLALESMMGGAGAPALPPVGSYVPLLQIVPAPPVAKITPPSLPAQH